MLNKKRDKTARRSLDSLQRNEPSFKFTVSYAPDVNLEPASIKKKSTRTSRLSLDQLLLTSYTPADSISKIVPDDVLSTAHNTNNNTPRLMDDHTITTSSTKRTSTKSAKTNIFHRLSVGGGVVIAGSLAQDAIKGMLFLFCLVFACWGKLLL